MLDVISAFPEVFCIAFKWEQMQVFSRGVFFHLDLY